MHATACPRCRTPIEPSQPCPRCSSGLKHGAARLQLNLGDSRPALPWQQTPGGRVLLGTLLALGLSYGLLQIGMAALNALGIDATSGTIDPLAGLIVFQGLQVLAMLAGGMLTGAGQERGSFLGGLAGLLTGVGVLAGMLAGVASTVVQSYSSELLSPGSPTHDLIMFALPAQSLVVGAIGGFIGSVIWKPLLIPTDPRFSSLSQRTNARKDKLEGPSLRWTGPVAWFRVILGAAIAGVGALNASRIVDFVLGVSDYKLRVVTQFENHVAYGEVFGLCILFGGCFAGATRPNGLKQGVCVGFLVSVIMIGAISSASLDHAPSALFPVVSALLLAPVGGWFGSELFPPACRRHFRVRFWS